MSHYTYSLNISDKCKIEPSLFNVFAYFRARISKYIIYNNPSIQ